MGTTSLTNKSFFKKRNVLVISWQLFLDVLSQTKVLLFFTHQQLFNLSLFLWTQPLTILCYNFSLCIWQLSILDLAALDILHFNFNMGFLSSYITDMLKRPSQLPLRTFCHRPILGCAAVKFVKGSKFRFHFLITTFSPFL